MAQRKLYVVSWETSWGTGDVPVRMTTEQVEELRTQFRKDERLGVVKRWRIEDTQEDAVSYPKLLEEIDKSGRAPEYR